MEGEWSEPDGPIFPHLSWTYLCCDTVMWSVDSLLSPHRTSSTGNQSAGFLQPPQVIPVSSGACVSQPIRTLPGFHSRSSLALCCSHWVWRVGRWEAAEAWSQPRDTWRTECGPAWLQLSRPTDGWGWRRHTAPGRRAGSVSSDTIPRGSAWWGTQLRTNINTKVSELKEVNGSVEQIDMWSSVNIKIWIRAALKVQSSQIHHVDVCGSQTKQNPPNLWTVCALRIRELNQSEMLQLLLLKTKAAE